MDLHHFDQDDITNILRDRVGIGITKSTFMRYNQQGFILMPQKYAYTRGCSRRVLYHSLVPVEIATAYLLFRGDWLRPNSRIRMARATDQDAFVGRLLFYLSLISDSSAGVKVPFGYDFGDFFTSVRYYVPFEVFHSDTVGMDAESIGSFLDIYESHILKPVFNSGIGPSYLRYVADSYRITFLHLYGEIFPGNRLKRLKGNRVAPPEF